MIRQAKKDDVNQIVNIKISSWNDTYKGVISNDILNKMDYDTEHEKFIKNFENRKIAVYEENGEILGYAYYTERENPDENLKDYTSEIQALYVKKDYRRNGIGTQLIEYIFNELKENKNDKVLLWCAKGNENAIDFYKKNNFIFLKDETQNYNGGKIEEICFGKNLI